MTTDDLRAYLDAHGVDGAPTVPGWYAVDAFDGTFTRIGVAEVDDDGDIWWGGSTAPICCAVRHAPLPDFGAMARDLAELRAKVPTVCPRCHGGPYNDIPYSVDACHECGGTGAVWVTP